MRTVSYNTHIMQQEFFLGSISVQPELIPVIKALEAGFDGGTIQGSVREFQAILDQADLTPTNFHLMITTAFRGIVTPKGIHFDTSDINQHDQDFAKQFLDNGAIEAWVEPALIHKDHPLVSVRSKNNVHVGAYPSTLPLQDTLVTADQIVSAHYLRFTVEDRPMVLADLAQAIANQNINICEIRQPEPKKEVLDSRTGLVIQVPEEEVGPTEIAFLLDPCRLGQVHSAVSAIKRLPACLVSNAVYKVIGNPTRDISKRTEK